ncbi:MAG: hypothetical protein U0X40_05280 [Ferruginibacter sp.]
MLHKKFSLLSAFLLGGLFLTTVAVSSCNDSGESKENKTDTPVPPKMDTMPAAPDSNKAKMASPPDSAKMDTTVKVKGKPVHNP